MANRITKLIKRMFSSWPDSGSSFDASGHGDRWPRSSQLWSPVSQSLAAAGPISTRADWLANNSPTAASYVDVNVNNLVSTGPTVRSGHPDEATRRLLEQRWQQFAARCDAEGIGTLVGYLSKAVRNWVITGESFTHMVIEDRQLRLRLLNTEQVWRPYTRVLPNARRIFSGVEVSESGKRLAYHTIPVQMDLPWAVYPLPERISADDMLHMFIPQFPGAVRGISWLTPIAARLLELDRLEDALLARMNTAALFSGFITDVDNTSGFTTDTHLNRDGKPELSMEPGALRLLPPGCSVSWPANIPDTAGSAEILKHFLRSIASGGGVPSALLTGDMSDSSYASARMGLEPFKRAVGRIQQAYVVAQLLQPVWERFITVEVLSGRLAAPDFEQRPEDYFAVDWRWPAWASLDPIKDATADTMALDANLKSRAEIIAARGRDIEDVDREIEADPLPRRAAAPAVQPNEESEDA